MKILCTLCEQQFESLLIDHQKALRELSTRLITHIASSTEANHKQLYQEVGRANAEIIPGIAWLLVMKGAEIPEDEEFILAEQERISDLIADWLAPDNEGADEEAPTPEGLREMLVSLNANETMLPGYDEIVEYVFGSQDDPEPTAQDLQQPAPKSL